MPATAPAPRFDSDLQMFVEQPHQADYRHLVFMRWLADRGLLEHTAAGVPCGAFATLPEPGGRPQ